MHVGKCAKCNVAKMRQGVKPNVTKVRNQRLRWKCKLPKCEMQRHQVAKSKAPKCEIKGGHSAKSKVASVRNSTLPGCKI